MISNNNNINYERITQELILLFYFLKVFSQNYETIIGAILKMFFTCFSP